MQRCQPTFPELRSQRDDMGSGRRSHPDTCRCAVRGTISAANCGAGAPRFCLVCKEAVKAASYNSALTAIGSGPGKRKRRSDLLPAHGGPRRCPGSCISVPAFAFRGGLWVRTATEARVFQVSLDAQGRSPARPAADGAASWLRSCCQAAGQRQDTRGTTAKGAYPPSSWLTPDCASECLRPFASNEASESRTESPPPATADALAPFAWRAHERRMCSHSPLPI